MKAYPKKNAGLWLDHRQAFIVFITEEGETIERIESSMERKVRLSGGARSAKTPYGPQQVSVDGKQEKRIKRQLREYYLEIIGRIRGANKIVILGPGVAKTELKKEMEKSRGLAAKIVTMESADKMTEKQIVAKVKEFFSIKT